MRKNSVELVAQRRDLEAQLQEAEAELSNGRAAVEELQYALVVDGTSDANVIAVTAAEEKVSDLTAQVERLKAGIKGTAIREKAAAADESAAERKKAAAEIIANAQTATDLARQVPEKLAELIDLIDRAVAAQDAATLTAKRYGISLPAWGLRREFGAIIEGAMWDLLKSLPALLPIIGHPGGQRLLDAQVRIAEGWQVEVK